VKKSSEEPKPFTQRRRVENGAKKRVQSAFATLPALVPLRGMRLFIYSFGPLPQSSAAEPLTVSREKEKESSRSAPPGPLVGPPTLSRIVYRRLLVTM
jgi:hypothetical protein